MCGIGGFCLSPSEHGKIDSDHLAAMLLLNLEVRGRHATGQAWRDGKGQIRTRKAPVAANAWVKRGEHKSGAGTRILHTRYATQGSPENPVNNHPIVTGRITGTHNGTLSNDDALFDLLGSQRIGEVDSEAIFAVLEHGKLPTTDALELPEGRAAVAWLDQSDRDNTLHLARLSGSPLAVGQTKRGSFIYASTMDILTESCEQAQVDLDWVQHVTEGNYFRVTDGRLVSCEVFKPARGSWTFGGRTVRKPVGARTTGSKPASGGKAKRKGKAKAKATKRTSPRVMAGFYLNDDGVWTDAALEVTRPVHPTEWEWDDLQGVDTQDLVQAGNGWGWDDPESLTGQQ